MGSRAFINDPGGGAVQPPGWKKATGWLPARGWTAPPPLGGGVRLKKNPDGEASTKSREVGRNDFFSDTTGYVLRTSRAGYTPSHDPAAEEITFLNSDA